MDLASYVNRFCLFFRDGRIDAGWISALQKNKLAIQPLQGKVLFLAPNRLLFDWHAAGITPSNALSELQRDWDDAHQKKNEHDLETIHQLLEAGSSFTLDTIAGDFLNDPDDAAEKLSLLLALREDNRWFKRNRDLTYTPRTEEEIEQLEIQAQRIREREAQKERIQGWIQELEGPKNESESWQEESRAKWLDQLEKMLVQGHESPAWKEVAPLLGWGQVMSYSEERKLKSWLNQAGRNVNPTRLIVLRANGGNLFENKDWLAVQDLSDQSLSGLDQVPDTHETLTIDGPKTRDFDDALTVISWNTTSIQLAVHITDLSRVLHPGTPLFHEAEQRISSVYTPEAVYPMFPEDLSNGIFSLKAGEERAVLSFHFQLFLKGGWQLQKVVPEKIRVQRNLSYAEADELIAKKEGFWETLLLCCEALLKSRLEEGALNLPRREFEINVSDPKRVLINPLDRNSPANRIIEELAVLVNRETGRLFHEASFPGIYRGQAPYELVKELKPDEEMTLDHISIEAAKLGMVAEPHAGLGCEFYMQATSPIRRFLDLVTQIQLTAMLGNKESVFTEDQLMSWAETIQTRQREYNRAEREVIHYWKSLYLQQHTGLTYQARVRRQLPQQRTELEISELDYVFATGGFEKLEPETELLLLLEEVQLEPLRLKLRACEADQGFPEHSWENTD
ncbi:MAG: ribonuclease catalytic domain-containing protein [bacterium]